MRTFIGFFCDLVTIEGLVNVLEKRMSLESIFPFKTFQLRIENVGLMSRGS